MNRVKSLPLIAVCLALATSASAITVTGPFVGTLQEDFESVTPVYHVPSVTVMGGELTISSPSSLVGVYQGGWGLGDKGSLNAGSTTIGFGNDGNSATYSFNFTNAVTDFGGYWNTAWIGSSLDLAFYDAGNNLLGTDSWITPNNNILNWRGWSSSVGIARIDVLPGNHLSNESIAFDNLQANVAAAPDSGATAALLGLALVGLAALRRKS
ncbi:MAG TPA: VPDSG-CTERM sorting domain-containing protein [Lacunisphaera sp.]|nr:VPDSG-CTERM sorting domain-containing protein [Lacunisphaera sp.]